MNAVPKLCGGIDYGFRPEGSSWWSDCNGTVYTPLLNPRKIKPMPPDFNTSFNTAIRHTPSRRDRMEKIPVGLRYGAACHSLLIDIPTGFGETTAFSLRGF